MLTWMDSLKGRSMMRLASFTDEEMVNLIDLSAQLKARRAAGQCADAGTLGRVAGAANAGGEKSGQNGNDCNLFHSFSHLVPSLPPRGKAAQ